MALNASSANANLANAKALLTAAATVVLARSVANDLWPPQLRSYLYNGFRDFCNRFSSQLTMVIDEMDGLCPNQIYDDANTYLATKVSSSTHRLKVTKPEREDSITTSIGSNQRITDTFNGVQFHWVRVCSHVESHNIYNPCVPFRSTVRSFELCFHKKHRDMVLKTYLPHILHQAKELKQQTKTLKIYTVNNRHMFNNISNLWTPINLNHPAMDSEIKDFILRDLERFVKRKEFYRKVGKAWKRGYLLYGPPGTGKSSLIAAIANYLKFDVYDLELKDIRGNSDCREWQIF